MNYQQSVSNRRSSMLKKNIIASLVAKGCSAVIVFLMVPITLNCLGEYTNGVWLTISSVMLWIDNLDIGLGNGLRNKLAVYLAHNEEERARILVSSAFAMLTIIIIPALLLLIAFFTVCDTYQLLNVDPAKVSGLDQILIITLIFVCTTFILKLIGNFYMGMQLPAVSNILIATGQTLALIGTFAIYKSGSHSLLHIALVNTAAPLLVYVTAYPYTFWYKYPHLRPSIRMVSLKEAKEVITMGVQFFVIQLSGVILFMTSNILISNLFTPSMVTPYQIAYRYFSILLVVFTVVCMPFWNATTDAYERGDMQWICNATRKLRLMTIGLLLCFAVMILLSDIVYSVWIGDEVTIDIKMSIAIAVYIFILIYSMRYSYFINGIGRLRLQLIFSASAAVLFIPLAWLVVQWRHDIIWFIAVMCLVNIPGLIANRIQFSKLISKQAQGIRNK
jgi:O-antigen/teichoic acid export membrane protein